MSTHTQPLSIPFEAIRPLEDTPPEAWTSVNNTVTPFYILGWVVFLDELMHKYNEIDADTTGGFLFLLVRAYSDSHPDLSRRITLRLKEAGAEHLILYITTNSSVASLKNARDRDAIDTIKNFLHMDEDPKWYAPKAFRCLERYQVAEIIQNFELNSVHLVAFNSNSATVPSLQQSEPMISSSAYIRPMSSPFEAIRPLEDTPPEAWTSVNNTVTPFYMLGWVVFLDELMHKYNEIDADTTGGFLFLLVRAYSDSHPHLSRRITLRLKEAGAEHLILYITTNSSVASLKNARDRDAIDTIKKFLRIAEDPKWYAPKAFRCLKRYQVDEIIQKFELNSDRLVASNSDSATVPPLQQSELTISSRRHVLPVSSPFEAIRPLEDMPPQSRTLVNNTVTPFYILGWAVLLQELMDKFDELDADTTGGFLSQLVRAYSDSHPHLSRRITFQMKDAGTEHQILYIATNSSVASRKIASDRDAIDVIKQFLRIDEDPKWYSAKAFRCLERYQVEEIIQKFESNTTS